MSDTKAGPVGSIRGGSTIPATSLSPFDRRLQTGDRTPTLLYHNYLQNAAASHGIGLPQLFYLTNYTSIYELLHRKHFNRGRMDLDPWGGIPMTIQPKDRDPKGLGRKMGISYRVHLATIQGIG